MKPVSVVIPTIGRREFLDIAVGSLLQQKEPFAEVLVFDNSSEQNLRQVSTFGDNPHVTWEQSGRQLDALDSWNTAVERGRNDYVTIFGDDDLALPNLHSQIQDVLERSDFGLLPFERIDEYGRKDGVLSGLYHDVTPRQLRYLRFQGSVGMVVPGVAFRQDKFLRIGGFQSVGLPNYLFPDELLWLKLSALESNVAVADAACWQYRKHRSSLGNVASFRGFRGHVAPYVEMLRDSLVALGVPDTDVFPPNFGPRQYINQIQASWFMSVVMNTLKSRALNPATYLRETWYYLSSEATPGGKVMGLLQLVRRLAWHVVRWASPPKGT
jgi:glycosyltransferase involved in cell wall biosynthesis